jgi:hypothetical protein
MLLAIKRVLLISAALWLSGCSQTSVRHHQDFQAVAKTIDTVVIVPADVEIELINFNGDNEQLEEKAESIKKQIHVLAANKLTQEHLTVIDFDFKNEAAKDEDFAYALTQVKEAWGKAKEEMYKTGMIDEKKKANFKTNLGSVLNSIADKTGADAVVLMHYSGFEKSSGMITKDIASSVLVGVLTLGAVVPIQATAGAFLDVALVETASGKVIWANRKFGASADASPAEIAFKELPNLVWKSELPTNKVIEQAVEEKTDSAVKAVSPQAN